MTHYCRHCGGYSRDACSLYSGQALADELRQCGNLYPSDRYGALLQAGVETEIDRENDRLQEENAELRRRLNALTLGDAQPDVKPLTNAEQREQGARCSCRGTDDLCLCQNVPDQQTRERRGA